MTLHFLPTFLVTAVKHLASKAVMGFFPNFDLPLHQSTNLLLLAQATSF